MTNNRVQRHWRSTAGVSQHSLWDGAENRTHSVSSLCSLAPSDQWFLARSPRSVLALSAPRALLKKFINLPEFTALGGIMQSHGCSSVVLSGVLEPSQTKWTWLIVLKDGSLPLKHKPQDSRFTVKSRLRLVGVINWSIRCGEVAKTAFDLVVLTLEAVQLWSCDTVPEPVGSEELTKTFTEPATMPCLSLSRKCSSWMLTHNNQGLNVSVAHKPQAEEVAYS